MDGLPPEELSTEVDPRTPADPDQPLQRATRPNNLPFHRHLPTTAFSATPGSRSCTMNAPNNGGAIHVADLKPNPPMRMGSVAKRRVLLLLISARNPAHECAQNFQHALIVLGSVLNGLTGGAMFAKHGGNGGLHIEGGFAKPTASRGPKRWLPTTSSPPPTACRRCAERTTAELPDPPNKLSASH